MTTSVAFPGDRIRTISLSLIVVIGLLVIVPLARWIDARRPPRDPSAIDESLYLNGKSARRMSLAFNGLVADWYWMRSLQYVGGKIINLPENAQLDDLSQLNLKLLPALLDTTTTLDPEFLDPYGYAAVVLPAVDVNEAIRITKKGIDANPNAWRLYQHLGYIYWEQRNYKAAAETYGRGAQIPGVPAWMEAMKARMAVEGGSRDTAREIYRRMYEQSTDEQVREMARRRLLQVDALDQIDVLNKLLVNYQTVNGHCPVDWRELGPTLRARRITIDPSGVPLDPSGTPYLLGKTNCDVHVNPASDVPFK